MIWKKKCIQVYIHYICAHLKLFLHLILEIHISFYLFGDTEFTHFKLRVNKCRYNNKNQVETGQKLIIEINELHRAKYAALHFVSHLP